MVELSSRPLTSSPADTLLYVRRPADDSLDRAVEFGLNVLISSPRGAGATTALYRLQGDHPGRSTYVSLPKAGSAGEIMIPLINIVGPGPEGIVDVARDFGDRFRTASTLDLLKQRLVRHGATSSRPWLAFLDGPVPADGAHQLFGGLRDELFDLPLRWVVVAPAERLGEYLAPPADVFFEHVVHLDALPSEGIRDMLERRGILDRVGESRFEDIARLGDGIPRRTLALARRAVMKPDEDLADGGYTEWLERRAELSRSAATLFEALAGRPPVTASDDDLLKHLGWSEMRVRRALQELADAGLVRSSQGRSTGPGRPPTVYQLAPGPPGYHDEQSLV